MGRGGNAAFGPSTSSSKGTHKAEAQKTLASRYEISDQAQLDALYERQAKLLERRPTPIKEDFVDTLSQLERFWCRQAMRHPAHLRR